MNIHLIHWKAKSFLAIKRALKHLHRTLTLFLTVCTHFFTRSLLSILFLLLLCNSSTEWRLLFSSKLLGRGLKDNNDYLPGITWFQSLRSRPLFWLNIYRFLYLHAKTSPAHHTAEATTAAYAANTAPISTPAAAQSVVTAHTAALTLPTLHTALTGPSV